MVACRTDTYARVVTPASRLETDASCAEIPLESVVAHRVQWCVSVEASTTIPPNSIIETEQVQVAVAPRDLEEQWHPEERPVEDEWARVGVVVERIAPVIPTDYGSRLTNDDRHGVVVGQVHYVRLHRQNFDALSAADHGLTLVGLKVAREPGGIAEPFDRFEHIGFLREHCIAQRRRPFQILAEQLNSLRVIQECDDRAVPIGVWLRTLLRVGVEKTLRLYDL